MPESARDERTPSASQGDLVPGGRWTRQAASSAWPNLLPLQEGLWLRRGALWDSVCVCIFYRQRKILFPVYFRFGPRSSLWVFLKQNENTSDSSSQRRSEGKRTRERVRELDFGNLDSINPQDM